MPLLLSDLESVRADAFADDIEILDKMRHWTLEQATRYFESGGEDVPADVAAPATAPLPLMRRPRIALFHGTASCESILKMQLGRLLPVLRELGDIFVIEGSLVVDEDAPQVAEVRKFFGDKHVLKQYALPEVSENGWRTYSRLDAAVAHLEAQLSKLPGGGGADVLLGFSQGANLLTCLCARGAPAKPYRGVIMLAPSKPGWSQQLPELFAKPQTTPALLCYSETDTVGTGHAEVASLWDSQCLRKLKHAGPGHRPTPADREEMAQFIATVKQFIEEHCPTSAA